jgi:MFS family permease
MHSCVESVVSQEVRALSARSHPHADFEERQDHPNEFIVRPSQTARTDQERSGRARRGAVRVQVPSSVRFVGAALRSPYRYPVDTGVGKTRRNGGRSTGRCIVPGRGRNSVSLPRPFRRLLFAWFAALSGDGLRMVALPLLAAALTGGNAGQVALVAACTSAPWLLVAVPAGTAADRIPAYVTIRTAHLSRAVLTAALALAVANAWATVTLLCVAGFLLTTAETFADAAAQRLLVGTVPEAGLERANSRFALVETVALDLVGPLAAGLTFVVAPWLPFVLSAGTFVVAGTALRRDRDVERRTGGATSASPPVVGPGPVTAEPVTARSGRARAVSATVWFLREIGSGLRALFADPVLRVLVLTVAVLAVANAAQDGVLVVYTERSLGLSSSLYPTLLVCYSIGILVTAPLVDRISARWGSGRTMMVALGGLGVTMLLMGLWPVPAVAWVCYAAMGVAGVSWNVLSASRRQRRTPAGMVARVSSAFRVLAYGAAPVGNVLGGVVASHLGLPAVFVGAGAVVLVLLLVVHRSFLRPVEPVDTQTSTLEVPDASDSVEG